MISHPRLERIEEKLNPYVLSGYSWANPADITVSFIPDGTPTDYGAPSNLFAVLDQVAPRATWQGEYARALATWSAVTNINFRFVPDDGSPIAVEGPGQGDPRFGDIRLGGYPSTLFLAEAYFPGDFTLAGDTFINTDPTVVWHVGQVYDLYSTFLHETGHALGLEHSLVGGVMWPGTSAVYPGLYPDDVAGIQAIYGVKTTPPPLPSLSINDVFQSEGNSGTTTFTFTVTLSAPSADTVTVNYTTTDGTATVGSDYTTASDVLIFTPGQTQQTVTVLVNGDTTFEQNETFFVNLTAPVNATVTTSQGVGTIMNDDQGPDPYEPNDTLVTAWNLGSVNNATVSASFHTATDHDFYRGTAKFTNDYRFSVTGAGSVTLVVRDDSGNVLASGGPTLTVHLTKNQVFTVEVYSPAGELFTYVLNIQRVTGHP